MKKLELHNLGVQEMNTTEMLNTQGGDFMTDLFGILNGVVGNVNNLLGNTITFLNKILGPLVNIGIGPIPKF